jgi:hypothetical protein
MIRAGDYEREEGGLLVPRRRGIERAHPQWMGGPGFFSGASGGGGSPVYSIVGVSTNPSTGSISVPAGSAAGDLLILCYTNGGTGVTFTTHASFTTVFNAGTATGVVCWRSMQAGDTSFSLPSMYITLIAVRKSTGSAAIDTSNSTIYTANGTQTTPTLTPSVSNSLSLMLFLSGQGVYTSAPSYTNLITYNVSGINVCGMAASWTTLSTASAFAGTTAGGVAGASHNAVACQIIVK